MFRRVGLDGKLLFSVMAVALLAACAPPGGAPDGLVTPPDTVVTSPPAGRPSGNQPMPPVTDQNPYAPQPADNQLMRGNVYLDSIQLLSMESYPPQIALLLQGSLPTPCNHLRVAVSAPDAKKRIFIDVYSVIDPNQICIQMLAPLEVNIPLGSFPPGHYSVWVNGEKIGEFDS